ncbi:hypothetical protein MNR02_06570 [Shinella sp. H4-D48]|uniref:hypothetical protein n=1 Tax=Shinella sp. H4-D48 TaxID=2925841 RepID=UPI001F52E9D1|nr:hypothetical protein [Shinella sp. H4-D48]UNK39365.1 hypothetical protein MNR02_06570 [Shinella sp. H4-D48]
MNRIRSLVCAGLALVAMAFTIAAPAIAATPTDPGVYEAVKASIETPASLQVHNDAVALTCEAPAVMVSTAAGRSSFPTDERVTIADASGTRLNLIEVRSRC